MLRVGRRNVPPDGTAWNNVYAGQEFVDTRSLQHTYDGG